MATVMLKKMLSAFHNEFSKAWENILIKLDTNQAQLVTGNRLRPQICLLGYLATIQPNDWGTIDYSVISDLSVSIELVHKASLILDDWIDKDHSRHGLPTYYTESSPEHAVMFALKMIGLSMYRLKHIFSSDAVLPQNYLLCLDNLIDTIYAMACGAYREISMTQSEIFDNKTVLEIAKLETSEIIGNSLLLGYYTGIGDKHNQLVEQQFKSIGDRCGFIFQVMNDMEVFSNPVELKKHKGSLNYDFTMLRKNIVLSMVYDISSKDDKKKISGGDFSTVVSMVEKYQMITYLNCVIENQFLQMRNEVNKLQIIGLPPAWCELFCDFLDLVKQFAEARL